MIGVQQWAEIRGMRFVEGLGVREIRRRTGLHRETIRRALVSPTAPVYGRSARGSKLAIAVSSNRAHRPVGDRSAHRANALPGSTPTGVVR